MSGEHSILNIPIDPEPVGLASLGFSLNPWIIIVVLVALLVLWYLFGSLLRGMFSSSSKPPLITEDREDFQKHYVERKHHMPHTSNTPEDDAQHPQKYDVDSDVDESDFLAPLILGSMPLGGIIEVLSLNQTVQKANIEELPDETTVESLLSDVLESGLELGPESGPPKRGRKKKVVS